jgi:DNA-binding NtrC family response regulator
MKTQQLALQSENGSPFWEIKILLVETSRSVIRLVEKVFEETTTGYFLHKIDNIHDLNFELEYKKPDIIISGRNMHVFRGTDVLNKVQLLAPEIPVIILVTDFNAIENTALVNQGAYDIIYHSELNRLPKEVNFLFQSSVLQQVS